MKILTAQHKGQTLVIILLGTSVALTVALAVSVRTISSLRQTTTTARAQAALAAAEAGAEVGLDCLKNGGNETTCNQASPLAITETATNYTYATTKAGGSSDAYLLDLAKDVTQEVKLGGYNTGSVKVYWYNPGLDGVAEPDNALEIIYVNAAGATATMSKFAFNGKASLSGNGFTTTSNNSGYQVAVEGRAVPFNHYETINFGGTPGANSILRIKAFYNNISAAVEPQGGASLPAQGFVINAVGKTADGSVTKQIRVTKSLPALPAIFDFGLYSGSATQPLSK